MDAEAAAPLTFAVVGHVDHGKSTLIGRLLLDSGAVHPTRRRQIEAIAARRGGRVEWANLLDAFQAERDQNITIDTGQIWFRATALGAAPRDFRIVDAPGHREFLKHMVTGAAQADAAVLVIDAAEGVQAQTRSHAWLLRLVDVRQLVVAVNKMDRVGYAEDRFAAVQRDALAALRALGLDAPRVVPMAAYAGENVVRRSPALAWWRGPTLLGALAELTPPARPTDRPLRFVVQDVYRFDERRILAGRVESGRLAVGDQLLFSPGHKPAVVKSIEAWAAAPTAAAGAGASIGITLTEQVFVERGHVGSHVDRGPLVGSQLEATVFWMGDAPLTVGRAYRIKLGAQEADCRVVAVGAVTDASSLEPVARATPQVARYEVGTVTLAVARPLAFDDASAIAATGRLVLVDGFRIAGGGRITAAADARRDTVKSRNITWTAAAVTADDRARRHGHPGSVVWLTGLSASGKSTLARALERRLFDDGRAVSVLDGDNLRFGLNSDLGFADTDRSENIRRVSEVARLLAMSGQVAVVALITPFQRDRAVARAICMDHPFLEVFVDCPVEVCASRDPKGLYRRAQAGEIAGFTGVTAPYEPPVMPDVHVHTDRVGVDAAAEQVLAALAAAWERAVRA